MILHATTAQASTSGHGDDNNAQGQNHTEHDDNETDDAAGHIGDHAENETDDGTTTHVEDMNENETGDD